MELRHERLIEVAQANAPLIGHDTHQIPGAIEQANGIDGPGKPPDVVLTVEVSHLVNHRPIAIDEDGRTSHCPVSEDPWTCRETAANTVPTSMRFMQR